MNKFSSPSQKLRLAAASGAALIVVGLIELHFYPKVVLSSFSSKPELPPLWLGIIGLTLYACYMYGFAFIGRLFRKPWLEWSAYWVMVQAFITAAISLLYPQMFRSLTGTGVVYGIINSAAVIIVGWSVMRMHKHFGPVGVWYGILAMLSGGGIALILLGTYADMADSMLAFALGSLLLYRQAQRRHG